MLTQQIVNKETGEIQSERNLGENRDFVMIFRPSLPNLRELGKKDAKARVLFDLLIEHMDRENALMVSHKALSELLGWSIPTVERKIKILKELNFIDSLKSGQSNIYVMNASVVWTTFGNNRKYAKFRAAILIGASEQEDRRKKKRYTQLDLIPKVNEKKQKHTEKE